MDSNITAPVTSGAADRYALRAEARAAKARQVQERGILEAAGLPAAVRRAVHMTRTEGRTLEGILGSNETDHINFLERGLRAARSVCRLLLGRMPVGTGFLVAPGLLLTNNHVIPDAEAAADFIAEFDYELDSDDRPRAPQRFRLDPVQAFRTSTDLDYTLVAIQPSNALTSFGWLPLDPRTDKILEGEPVVVVQHPQGREKQLCLFHSELVDRDGPYIYYTTDTEIGSSGSPAFNRNWQVFGLHHALAATERTAKGAVHANEGIRVSAMVADLQAQAPELAERVLAQVVQATGRPTAPLVSVPAVSSEGELERRGTVLRSHPIAHYAGRTGYDPAFLGAGKLAVPLPVLADTLADDVTRMADGEFVLPYMHFSAVMSQSRRLAVFTACNIEGATHRSLGRGDRNPLKPGVELEASADKWLLDPRIPRDAQLGPELYDATKFDFGHVTRRQDPIWGSPADARIANDDTFHMTNCAPQHSDLNQKTWLTLENAVLDSAITEPKRRVTVITGPVLDPRDPEVLGVQVPTAFWKVVAWTEGGQLRARAFLQWQTRLIKQVQRELEGTASLDAAERWHVPLRDVVRLTGLDFGPLLAADRTRVRARLTAELAPRLAPGADA